SNRFIELCEHRIGGHGCLGPGIRDEKRRMTKSVVGIHGADCAYGHAVLLKHVPHLWQVVVHNIAESKNTVLGEGPSRMRGHPLDPGLKMLVLPLRLGSNISMGSQQP